MKRRRVVDAIAEVADDVAASAQRLDNAFFLVRIDLDEKIGAANAGQKPVLRHFRQVFASHDPVGPETYSLGQMRCDIAIVAGNDFYADAAIRKCRKRFPHPLLWRIEKQQESREGH